MADETTPSVDTGPGRELSWAEGIEARVEALEEKAGLKKTDDTADTKEDK
jgi:hypothetical protein